MNSDIGIQLDLNGSFKCQRCGACCATSGWVYVTASEITAIAAFLGLDQLTFTQQYLTHDRGWDLLSSPSFRPHCFLDSQNQCEIYPVRPQSCRTYPYQFSSMAEYREALKRCPELQRLVRKTGRQKTKK
ncbi:YkgJ family cysteine cluster protein [bacterium]|nr:YkgJ family cysteine cluster protein [bacterium]